MVEKTFSNKNVSNNNKKPNHNDKNFLRVEEVSILIIKEI